MTASNTHDDQEMSMDEILASIRRYVSSDEPSSKSDLKPVDSGPKKVVVPDPAHIQQPAPRLDIPKLNLNDDIVRLNDTGRDVGREAAPSDAGRNTARMDSRAEVRNSDVRDGDTRGQTKRFDPPFNNDLSIKQPQPNRFEPSLVTKLRPAADIQESTPESF
jgi:cell pole-organizing protein PopZ